MPLEKHKRYHRYRFSLHRLYRRKRVRVYTGIVLSLFTVSFFAFFTIRPTLTTIAGLIREIDDKKAIIEKMENKIRALGLAQKEYRQVEDSLYLIDEALPSQADFSILVRQIETLAYQNNANVIRIQFDNAKLKGEEKETTKKPTLKEKRTPQTIDLSLTVEGSFQNLKSLLAQLNQLRRISVVDAYDFKLDEKENKLALTLSAQAYFLEF